MSDRVMRRRSSRVEQQKRRGSRVMSTSAVQIRLTQDEAAAVTAAAAVARNYRRGSLAAALHANLMSLGSHHPDLHAFDIARRRLSNVSDVVSRKLSRTIGWRSLTVSIELVVSQGTTLCAQYMRGRLRRSGIFHRKLGLKRVRSTKLLSGDAVVNEVYPELNAVGAEIEKMHPHLFERIGRQVGCGSFSTEQRVHEALTDVAREMLRAGECSWAKIVALYAVAGGMAVDCVRQGKPEFLPVIQRAMSSVLKEDLATWIHANGGWHALAMKYRPPPTQKDWQSSTMVLIIAVSTTIVCIITLYFRTLLL